MEMSEGVNFNVQLFKKASGSEGKNPQFLLQLRRKEEKEFAPGPQDFN